jgi:prepilin-type N-terminal cleavage/methylation domain-containing protein/prepilin-type processing-associated H-X9-DG protein
MRRPARRPFTLIELLVVVAIIAILASMLLPALAKARDTAKGSECSTRLRTFAMWAEMYRDDNEEFYLPNRIWGDPGTYIFVNLIDDYMGSMANTSRLVGPRKNYFLCPSTGYQPNNTSSSTYIYNNWSYISDGWRICNYMITAYTGYGTYQTQPVAWRFKRNLGNVSPSLQFYLGEIKTASPQVGYLKTTSNVLYPHRSGFTTQMAFVDGHVEGRAFPLTTSLDRTFRFY